MKKLLALVLLVMFLIPLAVLPVFANEKVVNVGNKICPVSGDPVSGTSFVEYQGKRYGLCCPMCKAPFLKDPVKYIAQMEAKEKASASATAVVPVNSKSEKMEKGMEQGSL